MTGAYVVNMSAPANNNASPVSGATVPSAGNCTNGATYVSTGSNAVSTGTTCTASGLAHAYGDVAKLVNVSTNTLTANTAVPNNSNSAVPQALVNTIASLLQSCVNSNGLTAANGATNISFTGGGTSVLTLTPGAATDLFDGSLSFTLTNGGTTTATVTAASNTLAELVNAINASLSGVGVTAAQSNGVLTVTATAGTLAENGSLIDVGDDGSACGTLMALALPQTDDSVPQNTLQAAMNIAKNPYVNSANVQKLFGLITTQPAFTPVLTAAPPDWTVAVSYQTPLPESGGVVQTTGDAVVPTLDADDNVYVAEDNADPYNGTSTIACIDTFSRAGVLQSGTGWGCNAISGASSYVDIAPDALGNLWTANANNGTSNAGRYILQFSASNGNLLNSYSPAGPWIRKVMGSRHG